MGTGTRTGLGKVGGRVLAGFFLIGVLGGGSRFLSRTWEASREQIHERWVRRTVGELLRDLGAGGRPEFLDPLLRDGVVLRSLEVSPDPRETSFLRGMPQWTAGGARVWVRASLEEREESSYERPDVLELLAGEAVRAGVPYPLARRPSFWGSVRGLSGRPGAPGDLSAPSGLSLVSWGPRREGEEGGGGLRGAFLDFWSRFYAPLSEPRHYQALRRPSPGAREDGELGGALRRMVGAVGEDLAASWGQEGASPVRALAQLVEDFRAGGIRRGTEANVDMACSLLLRDPDLFVLSRRLTLEAWYLDHVPGPGEEPILRETRALRYLPWRERCLDLARALGRVLLSAGLSPEDLARTWPPVPGVPGRDLELPGGGGSRFDALSMVWDPLREHLDLRRGGTGNPLLLEPDAREDGGGLGPDSPRPLSFR